MATEQMKGASLRPSDYSEGGQLIDECNGLVEDSKFVLYDFNGRSDPRSCLLFSIKTDDGEMHPQYWSFGDPARFAPSEDGDTLVAQGSAGQLNENSNGAFLIQSLINAGFPENRVSDKAGDFVGLYAFWKRVPQPKRVGLEQTSGRDGQPAKALVPSEIHNMPWEDSKWPLNQPEGGTTPVAKAAPTADTGAVEKLATDFLVELVKGGDPVPRADISTKAYAAFMENPDRNAIVKLAYSEDFLKQLADMGMLAIGADGSVSKP